MAEIMAPGNLARVSAAQERLRSAADRTGQSLQRMERYFGKAAEAGTRLSQVTARPAIVLRDYFSFAIDRLLLQLADIGQMKVELKLIVNDQVIATVKKLKQLLQGLGGTMNVKLQGDSKKANVNLHSEASTKVTRVMQMNQINNSGGGAKSTIDDWIGRFAKIASALKDLGKAFKNFGSGFKSLADGWKNIAGSIKTLKDIFGKGKGKTPHPSKKAGDKTKSKAKDKTESKAKGKTESKAKDKTESKAKDKTETKAKSQTEPKMKGKTTPKSPAGLKSLPEEITKPTPLPKGPKLGGFSKILKGGSKVLKLIGKGASKAAAPLGAAMTIAEIATADNKKEATVKAGASMAGSLIGGAIGSAILPGVGTLIGGMLGGMAGDALGGFFGKKLFGKKKPAGEPKETSLLPADSTPAADSLKNASVPENLKPSVSSNSNNNYNIEVNDVMINFPKEEVDEDALALRIGRQIVSQMNAVMPNQA